MRKTAPVLSRRTLAVLVALICGSLVVTACSEQDATGTPEPTTAASNATPTPDAEPGPAARMGLKSGWGPTPDELDRALEMVQELPLPALAGQVIVADYDGTAAPVKQVATLRLGGVIAFTDNITSPAQIRRANQALQSGVKRRWPVLTSVDQEGGIVERVKGEATRFPTFMSAGAARDPQLTERAYRAGAAEMRGLGFLASYAPDADVTVGPRDPAIGSRSASSDPTIVSEQARAAAEGHLDAGVLPVLKHFPGHGSVASDSHLTLPVQRRSLGELRQIDLVPFADAIDSGLPAIMVGHLAVPAIEPGMPTSLSQRAINGVLRRELGFKGLVFTDSLQMAAITRRFGPGESAVRAVAAGADVVLMPPSALAARAGLVRAVREGRLPKRRLVESATRMVAWLLHQRALGAATGPPGSARAASESLSAEAITVVAGPCSGPLVKGAVTATGDPVAVRNFTRKARAAEMTVLPARTPPAKLSRAEPPPASRKKPRRPQAPGAKATSQRRQAYARALEKWQNAQRGYNRYLDQRAAWKRRETKRKAALASWRADDDARLSSATSIGFNGPATRPRGARIAVATNTPYVLAELSAPLRIATYGNTPGAMSALVEVLLGDARARGQLPVRMSGVPRRGC